MDSLFEGENHYYYQIADSYHNEDVAVWNTICSSDSSTKEIESSIQNSYEPKNLLDEYKYTYCSHRQNIPKNMQYSADEITTFPVKVVKKRNTANKKERRRTQSINTAFSSLRNKIPNVPIDTKLSKIKTLRLATSYILYLTRVLEGNQDPSNGFQAELITSLKLGKAEKKHLAKSSHHQFTIEQEIKRKKSSGRTGWPQDVWASELK